MSLSLYKVANDYKQALDELSGLDIDEQTLKDTLEGLAGDVEQKAVNVAAFIKNLEAECLAIKNARDELNEKLISKQLKIESIKRYLLTTLKDCGIKKVSSELFSISIRRTANVVDITDESLIPHDYYKELVISKPNKSLIRRALTEGYAVGGCKLIENEYLNIK